MSTEAKRQIHDIVREAERQGFVRDDRGRHTILIPPGTVRRLALPVTPRSDRAVRNSLALLRRHGFVWRGR